jgi:glycosyltransferase involved in cell wall biosynthesis
MQMVFTAIRVILKHNVDLIHAHGYEAALVAACCRVATRRPVLYSAHNQMGDELASYDFFKSERLANGLAWVLDRTVPKLSDRCIPHSANLQQFLLARGLAGRSEPVLNFGIDLAPKERVERAQLRQMLGLGNEPIVLYSGVIDRFQRLDLLLGAMQQVVERLPRAKLLILTAIPNAKHEQEIREQAACLGIAQNLILLAPSNMEKGHRLLSLCDVAVVPRPGAPGFPIKLLNYMAAERPCVMYASSSSGLSHGENVWLVRDDTSQALGEGIVRLLSSEQLRKRIAAGGYRFVRERHDRRQVAAQLCRAYVHSLRGRRRWGQIVQRPSVDAPSVAAIAAEASDPVRRMNYLEGAIHASA